MDKGHKTLVNEATELLRNKGITKISYEARLPNRAKVDILAFNESRRIVVECMVQVQPKWVIRKIEAYRPYVDELIFLVPPSETHKLKGITGIDQIWEAKTVPVYKKNILIKKVPDDLYYRILEIKAKLGCDTWIEFLRQIDKKLGDLLK